eukprot:Opistho-2@4589
MISSTAETSRLGHIIIVDDGDAGVIGFASTTMTVQETEPVAFAVIRRRGNSSGIATAIIDVVPGLSTARQGTANPNFVFSRTVLTWGDGDSDIRSIALFIVNDNVPSIPDKYLLLNITSTTAARPDAWQQSLTLKIADSGCPSGFRVSQGSSTDHQPRCVSAAGSASSNSNDLAVALSAGLVGGVVGLLSVAFAVWWRLSGQMRLKLSRATHAEFLEKHVAKQTGLVAAEVPRESVQILDRIGAGEFGIVSRARVIGLDGRPRLCAAKIMKQGATYEDRCNFLEEAAIMQGLHHHHIVALCGIVAADEPMLILLEYVPHGNCLQFVQAIPPSHRLPGGSTIRMLEVFCSHIALGMAYLEQMRVVHRDLAARNVMVGQDAFGEYICKVADFGMSGEMRGDKSYYKKGGREKLPYRWLSIECIRHQKFTHASDCWALGVTMWELFSFGETPYAGIAPSMLLSHLREGNRLAMPFACSHDFFSNIMAPCWSENPDERPAFDSIAAEIAQRLTRAPCVASPAVNRIRRRSNATAIPSNNAIQRGEYAMDVVNMSVTVADESQAHTQPYAEPDPESRGYIVCLGSPSVGRADDKSTVC